MSLLQSDWSLCGWSTWWQRGTTSLCCYVYSSFRSIISEQHISKSHGQLVPSCTKPSKASGSFL